MRTSGRAGGSSASSRASRPVRLPCSLVPPQADLPRSSDIARALSPSVPLRRLDLNPGGPHDARGRGRTGMIGGSGISHWSRITAYARWCWPWDGGASRAPPRPGMTARPTRATPPPITPASTLEAAPGGGAVVDPWLLLRVALRPESLLSPAMVSWALPGDARVNDAWLNRSVCAAARTPGGEPMFTWGDIVAAISTHGGDPVWLSTQEAASRLGVARSTPDELAKRSDPGLPGAPVIAGGGKVRRHLRWEGSQLGERYRAAAAGVAVGRGRPSKASPTVANGPVDWVAESRRFR